jgi:hypothetical protein
MNTLAKTQIMKGDRPTGDIRMLIINPNTSSSMTDALRPMVQSLGYPDVGQRSRSEEVIFVLNRDLRSTSHSTLPQFLEYHRSIRLLMPQNQLIFAYHIFYL